MCTGLSTCRNMIWFYRYLLFIPDHLPQRWQDEAWRRWYLAASRWIQRSRPNSGDWLSNARCAQCRSRSTVNKTPWKLNAHTIESKILGCMHVCIWDTNMYESLLYQGVCRCACAYTISSLDQHEDTLTSTCMCACSIGMHTHSCVHKCRSPCKCEAACTHRCTNTRATPIRR